MRIVPSFLIVVPLITALILACGGNSGTSKAPVGTDLVPNESTWPCSLATTAQVEKALVTKVLDAKVLGTACSWPGRDGKSVVFLQVINPGGAAFERFRARRDVQDVSKEASFPALFTSDNGNDLPAAWSIKGDATIFLTVENTSNIATRAQVLELLEAIRGKLP